MPPQPGSYSLAYTDLPFTVTADPDGLLVTYKATAPAPGSHARLGARAAVGDPKGGRTMLRNYRYLPTPEELVTDPLVGKRYLPVTTGVVTVASPGNGGVPLNVRAQALPRGRTAGGLTASAFVRATASGYLFVLSVDPDQEWHFPMSLFISTADLTGNAISGGVYSSPESRVPPLHHTHWVYGSWTTPPTQPPELISRLKFHDSSWRHVALTLDYTTQDVNVYIDGVRTTNKLNPEKFDGQSATPLNFLRDGDPFCETRICGNMTYWEDDWSYQRRPWRSEIAIGHRKPGAWWLEGQIAHFRMYEGVLTDEEILRVARQSKWEATGEQVSECVPLAELSDDGTFRDQLGRGCEWYDQNQAACSATVENEARLRCPFACAARRVCQPEMLPRDVTSAPAPAPARKFTIWDQVVHVRPRVGGRPDSFDRDGELQYLTDDFGRTMGTLCLPRGVEPQEYLKECKQWDPENVMNNCSRFMEIADDTCSWEADWLPEFTAEVVERKELSYYFWEKTLNGGFVSRAGARLPERWPVLDFYKGNMIRHVGIAPNIKEGSQNFNMYHCHPGAGGLQAASVEFYVSSTPDPEDWTLYVINMRLEGDKTMMMGRIDMDDQNEGEEVYFDQGCMWEGNATFPMLSAVHVGHEALLSPITAQAQWLTGSQMQEIFYRQRSGYQLRQGPREHERTRIDKQFPRVQEPYSQRLLMISPPLILQKRRAEGACSSEFSDGVVETLSHLAAEGRCQEPYTCTAGQIYACPADGPQALFFGLDEADPHKYSSGLGGRYVEYLSVIADHALLVREEILPGGQERGLVVRRTREFLDTLTEEVRLHNVLYSVEFGITTELLVTFDTRGGKVSSSSKVLHYVALVGDDLAFYITLQATCVLLVVIMAVDSFFTISHMRRGMKKGVYPSMGMVFLTLTDLALILCTASLLVLIIPNKATSGDETERIINRLVAIPWTDEVFSMAEKKLEHLEVLTELEFLLTNDESINNIAMIVAVILLVRIVAATSAHPRIALITSTLGYAFMDLFHFCIVFILLFVSFAAIATWRFGSGRRDMVGYSAALQALFDTLLGPPGVLSATGSAAEDPEMIVFLGLYFVVMFFILLNFILAIFVSAYGRLVADLEANEIEHDVVSDFCTMLIYIFRSARNAWPRRTDLINFIQTEVPPSPTITLRDIEDQFESGRSARFFIEYYSEFSLLKPEMEQAKKAVAPVEVVRGLVERVYDKVSTMEEDLKLVQRTVSLIKDGPPEPQSGAGENGKFDNGASAVGPKLIGADLRRLVELKKLGCISDADFQTHKEVLLASFGIAAGTQALEDREADQGEDPAEGPEEGAEQYEGDVLEAEVVARDTGEET
mmetsp:Transcript_24184/g.55181  ORF Transcript_24184/g.55181 Transcript_24184/m.55181 type:complete len:1352 (+) Transcript_24184:69-4124(+)